MSLETDGKIRKQGILRIDVGKPRTSSTVSVVEPISPQPSVDRLSVSFANDDKKSETPSIMRTSITENDEKEGEDDEGDEEEEYSASANVILNRKQDSWKRKGSMRRASVPFSPPPSGLRRRSSVFTSSSAETGVSVEDAANQNLKIHKEVVTQIKYQPWPIRRKLRLVHQAKSYIKLHEGQIQERLAQKKGFNDILAHLKIVFLHYWNYILREITNILYSMSPWESRIKEIESHFGSAVASYFTFHRWLFGVNLKISLAILVLIIIPEVLFASSDPTFSGDRKCMFSAEANKSEKFLTLWNFEGILKHSPFFYGYYNSRSTPVNSFENRLPFLYFVTGLGLYIYSFVAILRKMALNSRQSKLTEKDEDYIFTWKLFTSWDFMIGNPETAHNRVASIILGFKEALLEEAEKTREEKRNWKLFSIRLFTHLNVLFLLASSVYVVIYVVSRSQIAAAGNQSDKPSGWWSQNEVTIVITLIGMIYPVLFDLIGLVEKYHPRKALRLQLARIMVLNLLNLYAFIIATFTNINSLSSQSCQNMPNATMIEYYKKMEKNIKGQNISSVGFTSRLAAVALFLTGITDSPQTLSKLYDPTNAHEVFSMNMKNQPYIISSNYGHLDGEIDSDISNIINFPELTFDGKSKESVNYSESGSIKPSHDSYTTLVDTTTEESSMTTDLTYDNTESFYSTQFITATVSEDESSTTATDLENPTISSSLGNTSDGYSPFSLETTEAYINSTLKAGELAGQDNDTFLDNETTTGDSLAHSSTDFTESPNLLTTQPTFSNMPTLNPIQEGFTEIDTSTTSGSHFQSSTGIITRTKSVCEQRVRKDTPNVDFSPYVRFLKIEERMKVHSQCWETMFGQELVKLTVMDLAMTVVSILMVDFIRAIFVRILNKCWFWDLEKVFPQYGDFKIAENILHLVNNQGMVWMGMFFSPGLPLINVLKLIILMYMRSWAVLTCNVPHEVVFRASKSNNFYFGLLLTMLFLCVLPVGYALVWIDTSWHCGPFSKYNRIYYLFTYGLKNILPKSMHHVLDYIASPGIVIPLLVLLILIIFYLISLTNALREANDDLKIQLRRERTEERRKVYQMANKKRKGTDFSESPFNKWCHAMNNTLSRKASVDVTHSNTSDKLHNQQDKNSCKQEIEDGGISNVETNGSGLLLFKSHSEKERNDSIQEYFRDREDSVVSGWSIDHLPQIKISQIESVEGLTKDSPGTPSPSKSSSKETIINMCSDTTRTDEFCHDDVFLDNDQKESPKDENKKKMKEKQDDPENEDSSGLNESYESISKSLAEMDEIDKKEEPEIKEPSNESRRNLAKILVDSLIKK